jgi:sarcosine oxidase subunit beta
MRNSADVVIIGAGIIGASIAWHLAEAGCGKVVLLEKERHQGQGSTGKSMGGVRAQFATDANIRMSLHSIPFFATFEEQLGHPSGYRAQGYLFLATQPAHLTYLQRNVKRQQALGLQQVSIMSAAEAAELAPGVRMDDVLGASFCASDGFVDPHSILQGFMLRAQDKGVELRKSVQITGIETDSSGVAGVNTNDGFVPTRVIVNAAGPFAAAVAALAGVALPVRPLRRMLVPTEACPQLSRSLPMVVDMSTGFHFRPEALGVLMAWNDPGEEFSENTDFDAVFLEKILDRAVNRVPALAEVEVNPKRAWAGLYEVSPDHHAILGEAPGVPGFYLANGFSGHGVMHSPATGHILSDLILKGKSDLLDWNVLSLNRFATGRTLEESSVL